MAESTGASSSMHTTTWRCVMTGSSPAGWARSMSGSSPGCRSQARLDELPFLGVEAVGVVVHDVEELVRLAGLGQIVVRPVAEARPAVRVGRARAVDDDREQPAIL